MTKTIYLERRAFGWLKRFLSFFFALDDQLFDILEDEQEDAILRSKLQLEQTSLVERKHASNGRDQISDLADEPINQAFLFPIRSTNENKFLFNLTLDSKHNGLGGIDRPKNIILTLRKKSKDLTDANCMVSVQKQISDLKFDNLVKLAILDTADHKATSNLVKYNLNALMPTAFKTSTSIQPTIMEQELLLQFDTMDCLFDSAMVTIEYETLQVFII